MGRFKQFSVVMVVILALALGVGVVSAQGPRQGERPLARGIVGDYALIQAIADLAEIDVTEVRATLDEGMSLDDVAAAFELDSAAVVEAAAASITDYVEASVAVGRMSQEDADELLATLSDDLTALIVEVQEHPVLDSLRHLSSARYLLNALSEATGLSTADILAQMRNDGLAAAEIAEANDVDPQAVIDAAVAAATADLESSIDGLAEQFDTWMNQTLPEGRLGRSLFDDGHAPRGRQDRPGLRGDDTTETEDL